MGLQIIMNNLSAEQITNKMITRLFKMKFHLLLLHLLQMEHKPKKEIETYQQLKLLNQLHKISNQMQTELLDII